MGPSNLHAELHRTDRVGWLRAGVLGANDGILSVASLVVGVAAATPDRHTILLAGVAGLVAGAMSMAAVVVASTLVFLAVLGGLSAAAGGASILRGATRVAFWSVAAMAMTALIGWIFGVSVQ